MAKKVKLRNKHLNEVLMSRPAGKMKDKETFSRSQEKQKLHTDWKSYDFRSLSSNLSLANEST